MRNAANILWFLAAFAFVCLPLPGSLPTANAADLEADLEIVGDADAGERIFKICGGCHTIDEGGRTKDGPNLYTVIGRTAGTLEGFRYSKAMKAAGASGIVWGRKTLNEYLNDTWKYVPGNIMGLSSIGDATDRANVIAFIERETR